MGCTGCAFGMKVTWRGQRSRTQVEPGCSFLPGRCRARPVEQATGGTVWRAAGSVALLSLKHHRDEGSRRARWGVGVKAASQRQVEIDPIVQQEML